MDLVVAVVIAVPVVDVVVAFTAVVAIAVFAQCRALCALAANNNYVRPVWITFQCYNFSVVAVFTVIYNKTTQNHYQWPVAVTEKLETGRTHRLATTTSRFKLLEALLRYMVLQLLLL